MTDPPASSDIDDDTDVGPGRATPGRPRWVKVLGVIAIVLLLLIIGLQLFGGGRHGPFRHTPSDDAGGRTPPSSGTRDSVQQP